MSMPKYGAARDRGIELEIVYALKAVGATVLRAITIDLIVGYKGVNYLFEVKNIKGVLTDSQKHLQEYWQGDYRIVRSVEEALQIIGIDNLIKK